MTSCFSNFLFLYHFQVDIYVHVNMKCVLNEGVQVSFYFSRMRSARHLHVALKINITPRIKSIIVLILLIVLTCFRDRYTNGFEDDKQILIAHNVLGVSILKSSVGP